MNTQDEQRIREIVREEIEKEKSRQHSDFKRN